MIELLWLNLKLTQVNPDRGPQNSDKEEVEELWQKLDINQRTIEAMQLHERETDGFLLLGGSSAQTSGEQAARIPSPGSV